MSNDVNENRIFVSSIIKHTLVLTNVNIWKLIFDFFLHKRRCWRDCFCFCWFVCMHWFEDKSQLFSYCSPLEIHLFYLDFTTRCDVQTAIRNELAKLEMSLTEIITNKRQTEPMPFRFPISVAWTGRKLNIYTDEEIDSRTVCNWQRYVKTTCFQLNEWLTSVIFHRHFNWCTVWVFSVFPTLDQLCRLFDKNRTTTLQVTRWTSNVFSDFILWWWARPSRDLCASQIAIFG